MNSGGDEAALKEVLDRYHLGGVRYNPADARHVRLQNELLQKNSKIPLIVASNVEGGGDGACTDGTRVGKPTKIGATGNVKYARKMGYISGKEAMAVGSTLSFAPVVDILHNWHNSVVCNTLFLPGGGGGAGQCAGISAGCARSRTLLLRQAFPRRRYG